VTQDVVWLVSESGCIAIFYYDQGMYTNDNWTIPSIVLMLSANTAEGVGVLSQSRMRLLLTC